MIDPLSTTCSKNEKVFTLVLGLGILFFYIYLHSYIMSEVQHVNSTTKNHSTGFSLAKKEGEAMSFKRVFTNGKISPLDEIKYIKRSTKISNPDGSVVFELTDAEVPEHWSQVASDIMTSKYFRKAGVPQYDKKGNIKKDKDGNVITGPERSAKQVVRRLTSCWRNWGEEYGYFKSPEDAEIFQEELDFMLINQYAAPNSPQWFNTGLSDSYGITSPAQGHYYVDPITEELVASKDAYVRPQPHACFIQEVKDSLVNEGGIMDLWVREARLFKYGSGTGSNFSNIRGSGETLSGGGTSSGLMSFLRIGDRAAGAIKSGGTTRRAAKMVSLDLDHPDIEEFIDWKVNEEKKVAALIAAGYSSDFNGEAYSTVSGQNSNNSVRVPHEFLSSVENDKNWQLKWRTDGSVCKTLKAKDLMDKIAFAAWACADPGMQYDGTINDWHTCPKSGRINASNPCSEYMFLDNTACNLASLNLVKFFDPKKKTFDVAKFKHAVRVWTTVLEISVLMAQFPSKEIAKLSYDFRTLGLGFANLGTVLMLSGVPYDSPKATNFAGAIAAIMTGTSYATSAELSKYMGTFKEYDLNKSDMMRVMRNHRNAAYNADANKYENLPIKPVAIDPKNVSSYLVEAAKQSWDEAIEMGEKYGYRNAQTTVIAPTGTIGLLMDCDTTGVEPDFALVKFKKLAGGGYFKIANSSIKSALNILGYTDKQISEILTYIMGTLSLKNAPYINVDSLKEKGFTDEDISKIENSLPGVFELGFAFNHTALGANTMKTLGFTEKEYTDPKFNLLKKLGYSSKEINEANVFICGTMTLEGAPHLKEEHLAVFDCANKCGNTGQRYIHHMGHIRMMGAVQSFISGAISKTINMPNEATTEDIKDVYISSWKLGIKANAIYRDGCKLSQPLNTKSKVEVDEKKIVVKSEPARHKLPAERMSVTHKFSVAGHEGYITVGLYNEGKPGEIFIRMSKEGSTLSGVMDSFATSLSLNLQYGVPLDVLIKKLSHTRFEPAGITENREIPMVKSIMDYIGRWLAVRFLNKEGAAKFHNHDLVEKAFTTGSRSNIGDIMHMSDNHVEQDEVENTDGVSDVKLLGFTGSLCSECGSDKMKRNGSCELCTDCGATSGCS